MKKIISIILAAVLIVSCSLLAACGNSQTENESGKKEEKQVYTMATNAAFPPYEFYKGNDIVGIDAEIAKSIIESLGGELKIVDIEFDSIISGVQTGKYDMALAGLTVTDERKQSVDFSDSYATGKQVVIVKNDSPIKTVDDILAEDAKYKAGVQIATTGDIYASDDLGKDRIIEYNNGADAVSALIAGKVDCVIIDNEPAKSFVGSNKGLKILETEYVEEDYAAIFPKGSKLCAKFNSKLNELKADGTIQKIIDKYINADSSASSEVSK